MVLESLGQPNYLQKNPKELFFLSFSYTAIAILLSIWIFPNMVVLPWYFFSYGNNTFDVKDDNDGRKKYMIRSV